MTVLLLHFQFRFLLFLFLLWLPWLGLPKLCWIIVVRVDIIVLFLILEEMLSVFYHWEWCLLWVSLYGLYYVEVASLYVHCMGRFFFFCHKWVLNIVKTFLCIYFPSFLLSSIFIRALMNLTYVGSSQLDASTQRWSCHWSNALQLCKIHVLGHCDESGLQHFLQNNINVYYSSSTSAFLGHDGG